MRHRKVLRDNIQVMGVISELILLFLILNLELFRALLSQSSDDLPEEEESSGSAVSATKRPGVLKVGRTSIYRMLYD